LDDLYKLFFTNNFDKDLKRAVKRGYNIRLLQIVIESLEKTGKLDAKYLPHKLKGVYSDCIECHIKSDWLLIWSQNNRTKEITFIATGTHTDLF
jgi:mRNA interferase YafQ